MGLCRQFHNGWGTRGGIISESFVPLNKLIVYLGLTVAVLPCNFESMNELKIYFAIVFVILLIYSCKKDAPENNNQTPSPTPSSVLYSTSFEVNNSPDLTGWILFYDYYSGIPYDTIVGSSCPNGGTLALNLKTQKLHSSYAERYLTNLSGYKKLKLTFWATLYSGQNSVIASLTQLHNGTEIKSKEINLYVWNNWKEFIIQDTLNLSQTDSIRISFKGTGSTYESSDVICDLVKLEEL